MNLPFLNAASPINLAFILTLWINVLLADQFPFEPPQNFTLSPKYIKLHHPVTAKTIAAQLYFDQGLTLIYAFNHDAAYWSFLRASQEDPKMPMAYWGMALALGTNINMAITPERAKVAFDAVQKAETLASNATESERDYIHALSLRYPSASQADPKKSALQYSQAMRKLSDKYPEDLDAGVLFAESLMDLNPWSQWSLDGKPLEGTLEAVEKLESVLKKDPGNLGANHYYIHVVEASLHPEYALICAERLSSMLPASGHILHMPSHIYILVGDYHKAALANEEAVAADREYIREYGIEGIYPVHYLTHNLYFLSRAYAMGGCFSSAKRAAEDLAAFYAPHFKHMPELEYYACSPAFVLLRFHQWKEILALPEPSNDMQLVHILWHFHRAAAFASLGDLAKADEERKLFLAEKAKAPSDLMFGYNKADKILKIAEYFLDSKLSEGSKAIDFLRKAVSEQDTLRYNEPPDWSFPIREALGGALLRLKRYEEAAAVFREDLEKHPRNGRSLFGLKETLSAQSKVHDLFWVDKEFQQAWLYSDTNLTINDL